MTRVGRRPLLLLIVAALTLGGAVVLPQAHRAHAEPTTYVTMPDGVVIAMNVRMPKNFKSGHRYPTVFEMSGYESGSADDRTLAKDFGIPGLPHDDSRQLTRRFTDEYVTVHASLRGTGCSGGQFDLFSPTAADDGRHIIDQWIAKQAWSNGKVAIVGHSYSGITGFLVASRKPKHLVAMSVSGLIDDLYRGIAYPGGVSNYGFPLAWAGGIRPFYDVGGGLLEGLYAAQTECAAAAPTKSRTVLDDPLVQGMVETDTEWYRTRSLVTWASRVSVPTHITGAYQDEQTGPRFPHVWEALTDVPKRLLMTNGDHNAQNPEYTGPAVYQDRKDWIDHFTGVAAHHEFGAPKQDKTSVEVLFEFHRDAKGMLQPNGVLRDSSFPLSTTEWVDWYLRPDHALSTTTPPAGGGSDTWVAGTGRQSWSYQAGTTSGSELTTPDGPDQALFTSDAFAAPYAVVGPITANLFVQSTAPDSEVFVQVIDVAPDGSRSFLQRGMLKASHRAVDAGRSDYAGEHLYRPWHPHTNPTLITPGETYELLVEVFPLGHVFRPGHRLQVVLTAPPRVDSYYAYVPRTAPRVDTVLHDTEHPSRITLPVVPLDGVELGAALPCGAQEQVRCIPGPG